MKKYGSNTLKKQIVEDRVTRSLKEIPMNDLPPQVADIIYEIFKKTEAMDIYSGDAISYLEMQSVIWR